MNNGKMLVSDYDRTFYLNDADMARNAEGIRAFRNAGNIFVIATGRSLPDFKRKFAQYPFAYDYVILNHGATIVDGNDNILYNTTIVDGIAPEIQKILELGKAERTFCCTDRRNDLSFSDKNLTKIYVKYDSKKSVWQALERVRGQFGEFVNAYPVSERLLEIVPSSADKASAVDILSKKLQIDNKNIYTIGDGYTDIEMIRLYNGCCMKHSVSALKQLGVKEYESVSVLVNELI